MTNTTPTATVPASAEGATVSTITTHSISMETCDKCGPAVRATATATINGEAKLFFCNHHIRLNAGGLEQKGFQIFPPLS